MKNKILITFLLSLSLLLAPQLINAQEATNSAEEIQNDLKERIKKSVDENINKTLGEQDSLRAFVGLIESISEETISITINPNHGSATVIKQAIVTPDTNLIRVGQTDVQVEDFQIGDYILAMGSLQNQQTLQAQRIVVDDYTPPSSIRRIAYAQITQIEDDTITFSNHSPYLDDPLTISSNTTLTTVDQQEITLEDLQPNQSVTLVLSVDTDDQDTTILRLIAFPVSDQPDDSSNPATDSAQASTCGDGICQNVVCQGLGCPEPETPETCPADCTENWH